MSLWLAFGLAGLLVQSPAAQGGSVSGRVIEEGSGAPVSGAQVMLLLVPSGPMSVPFRDRPETATTDRDGRYTFDRVQPGKYRISAQKPGYAMEGFELQSVDVTGGIPVTAENVRLQRGGVIVGRVTDESGEPVVNVRVMAMRRPRPEVAAQRGDFLVPAGPGAETNDLGEFRLFSLAPGDYYVQAVPHAPFGGTEAPRASTILSTYFPSTPDPASAHPIRVAAGQTSGDIVVRMVTAPAFRVSGVVRDEAGRPVANAVVRLDLGDAQPLFMMVGVWNQARTDAEGRFTINNAINGSYTLLAIPPHVISGGPARRAPAGGRIVGGVTSMGFSSGGPNGPGTGAVMTETNAEGSTIQFRDDAGTRVPVTIQDADVSGLEVVVKRQSR